MSDQHDGHFLRAVAYSSPRVGQLQGSVITLPRMALQAGEGPFFCRYDEPFQKHCRVMAPRRSGIL
jgi:hypothetical protein